MVDETVPIETEDDDDEISNEEYDAELENLFSDD